MKKMFLMAIVAAMAASVSFGSDKGQCSEYCQKSKDIAKCITEKCDEPTSFYNNSRVRYNEMLWNIKSPGFFEFYEFLENSKNSKH